MLSTFAFRRPSIMCQFIDYISFSAFTLIFVFLLVCPSVFCQHICLLTAFPVICFFFASSLSSTVFCPICRLSSVSHQLVIVILSELRVYLLVSLSSAGRLFSLVCIQSFFNLSVFRLLSFVIFLLIYLSSSSCRESVCLHSDSTQSLFVCLFVCRSSVSRYPCFKICLPSFVVHLSSVHLLVCFRSSIFSHLFSDFCLRIRLSSFVCLLTIHLFSSICILLTLLLTMTINLL